MFNFFQVIFMCCFLLFLRETGNLLSIPTSTIQEEVYLLCDHDILESDAETRFRKPADSLNISGSAQFDVDSFIEIVNNLNQKHLIIVDLRREAHIFINGESFGLCGDHGWMDNGESAQKVLEFEHFWARKVSTDSDPLLCGRWCFPENEFNPIEKLLKLLSLNLGIIEAKIVQAMHKNKIQTFLECIFKLDMVLTEEELAHQYGAEYYRFPVTDNSYPSNQVVDDFILFFRNLPPDAWLHFHCKGGKGRTTTFLLLVDILRNAKYLNFKELVDRQVAIGGVALDQLKDPPKHESLARLEFLKFFYQYAKENQNEFETTWTEWLDSL